MESERMCVEDEIEEERAKTKEELEEEYREKEARAQAQVGAVFKISLVKIIIFVRFAASSSSIVDYIRVSAIMPFPVKKAFNNYLLSTKYCEI